jgi:hypothetical protein
VYRVRSAIDLGCGAGGWLHALEDHGVTDLLGVDGEHVRERTMEIKASEFRPHDLREPFSIDRRFDLAISTEVAEHLPDTSASSFVESLTRLAPVVLFSAAIPGQPGINHINCQWPSYWANLFQRFGFDAYDCIRPVVWDDERIDWWYRQNLVLYAKDAKDFNEALSPHAPAARVQVDSYLAALNDFHANEKNRRDLETASMRELLSMMPSRAALWLKQRARLRERLFVTRPTGTRPHPD